MIYFIDHHDSFSFNLIDWLRSANPSLMIKHVDCFDRNAMLEVLRNKHPLVLSPGPGEPLDYPNSMELIEKYCGQVPILGICLGHQMLATIFGARLQKVRSPMHGSVQKLQIAPEIYTKYLSAYLRNPAEVELTSYHSLTVDPKSLDLAKIEIIAVHEGSEIAGLKSKGLNYDCWSWQHHPESFLSTNSDFIRRHFVDMVLNYRYSNLT